MPHNYLLCSTPIYGHVAPMVAVGRHLVESGHRVRMLTGSAFKERVEAAGIEHIALPAEIDVDGQQTAASGGELRGVKRLRHDVESFFIAVMPGQYIAMREELARENADAILVDTAYTGLIPLLQEKDRPRPPALVCGVLPLTVSSRDTAPFGSGLAPSATFFGRIRNRILNLVIAKGVFGRSQKLAQATLAELGVNPLPGFVLDGPALADRLLQLTSASFEYPRSDLSTPVDFVGPVLPSAGRFEPPAWWDELDGTRPVVHVTQGTVANTDLGRLISPTLEALADADVLVVVCTGDEQSTQAVSATAPANARVAAFLPYDRLLPKVDVMVTNGGYGGVQFALAHGVPLVVAGDTEEKPEVAARVAWSGAGINLRTGSPSPARVDAAVHRILGDDRYRDAAATLAADLAACTPLQTIETELGIAVANARLARA